MIDPALAGLTVAALDAEVARLAADIATSDDPLVAGELAMRRLALLDARTVAGAREGAQRRRDEAEASEAVVVAFRALADDASATVAALGADIDRWLADGERLFAVYRDVVGRLVAVFEDVLLPAAPARRFELGVCRDRLLDLPLEAALVRARVLTPRPLPPTAMARTIADVVAARWQQFEREASLRVPTVLIASADLGDDEGGHDDA